MVTGGALGKKTEGSLEMEMVIVYVGDKKTKYGWKGKKKKKVRRNLSDRAFLEAIIKVFNMGMLSSNLW